MSTKCIFAVLTISILHFKSVCVVESADSDKPIINVKYDDMVKNWQNKSCVFPDKSLYQRDRNSDKPKLEQCDLLESETRNNTNQFKVQLCQGFYKYSDYFCTTDNHPNFAKNCLNVEAIGKIPKYDQGNFCSLALQLTKNITQLEFMHDLKDCNKNCGDSGDMKDICKLYVTIFYQFVNRKMCISGGIPKDTTGDTTKDTARGTAKEPAAAEVTTEKKSYSQPAETTNDPNVEDTTVLTETTTASLLSNETLQPGTSKSHGATSEEITTTEMSVPGKETNTEFPESPNNTAAKSSDNDVVPSDDIDETNGDTEDEKNEPQDDTVDADSNKKEDDLEDVVQTESEDKRVTSANKVGSGKENKLLDNLKETDGSARNVFVGEDETQASGHFLAYFLTAVVICISGYVIYHNKQKILAFIIEGRNGGKNGRQRSKDVKYSQLKSNVEEVMPSLEQTATTKNFVY